MPQQICHRGKWCFKYGCPRHHPEGRYVGRECQHDERCNGRHPSHPHKTCPFHHSDIKKNQKEKMIRLSRWWNYEHHRFCHKLTWRDCQDWECKFPHYDEPQQEPICFLDIKDYKKITERTPTPEPEPEPRPRAEPVKKRKAVKCGTCHEVGHNKRSCKWTDIVANIKNLPAPVV